jgi:uncharacterized membrane protein
MPLSLRDLVLLLIAAVAVFLIRTARSATRGRLELKPMGRPPRWQGKWPVTDHGADSGGDAERINPLKALGPEVYQVVFARSIYVLQFVAFGSFLIGTTRALILFVVLTCGAIFSSRSLRVRAAGTWLESHFSWQIRTGWLTLLWMLVIGAAESVQFDLQGSTLIERPAGFLASIWLLSRIVPGWNGLRSKSPMNAPNPASSSVGAQDRSRVRVLRVVYGVQVAALAVLLLTATAISGIDRYLPPPSLLLLCAAAASYILRRSARDTWLECHADWQMRASLFSALALISIQAVLVPLATALPLAILISLVSGITTAWLAYRIVRGWQALTAKGTLPAGNRSWHRKGARDGAKHYVSIAGIAVGVLIFAVYILGEFPAHF